MSSRRSSYALILASLALLVRLLAPGMAEARISFDPLTDAPICAHDASGSLAGDAPASDKHQTAKCDMSCCHAAPGFLASPTPGVSVVRSPATLAWRIPGTGFLVFHAPAAHRARGPPTVS